MFWIDAGVNLADKRLGDISTLRQQCDEYQITDIIAIGTTLADSIASNELAAKHSFVHSTAGIHPHYTKDSSDGDIVTLRELVSQSNVVAIGECGLDFNRNFSPPAIQLKRFEQQLVIACETGLPVYLHERDAFEYQYRLLKRYASDLGGGLVHCFTGNVQQMNAYLELGFHIGITGWLTDTKRGQSLRDAVAQLPLSRLVLETDAPYLVPKNIRPRPRQSSPVHIPFIATEFANLTGHSIEQVQRHSWQNTINLFSLADKAQ